MYFYNQSYRFIFAIINKVIAHKKAKDYEKENVQCIFQTGMGLSAFPNLNGVNLLKPIHARTIEIFID